jgi:amino acid transporter
MQFGLQAAGLLWLRASRPEVRRPFRMWLYPLPALLALAGFALVLADKAALLARAGLFAAVLLAIYFVREALRQPRITPSSFYEKGRTCPEEKYR